MGFLKDKRLYLSGPIQYDESGIDWRTSPKTILNDKFGINVFDPSCDPKQQWVPILNKAKEANDYDLMFEVAQKFVRKDLCMVDRSDMIIAYLPHKVPTTGTVHEIINSNNAKKPTLLVTNMNNISNIPLWYFGFIPKEFMFNNWEDLYTYLEKVDSGKCESNRWDFICGRV